MHIDLSSSDSFHITTTLTVDTFQDFLIAEHMRSCMHILEISISSLNHFVIRPTQTPKSADKKMPISDFQSDFSILKII